MNKIKLHLGCGERYIPGFIHIDTRKFNHVDVVESIDDLHYPDNSVDLIYACHVLEHFGRHEITRVLKEWYRILKLNGTLRISVPDFDAICYIHQQKDSDMELIMGLLYGGQDYKENYHNVGFDYNYLKRLLEDIGFRKIKRYDWRKTEHANIDDYSQSYLPHMDKEHGTLMSLNIEAEK